MSVTALLELPSHELGNLALALQFGRLRVPLTETDLRAAGLHACLPHLAALAKFSDVASLSAAIALLVAAARREGQRAPPEVVWSGPEPLDGRARSTAVVLEQLFEGAQTEVFIAGYAFDGGEDLLEPLHTAMVERGVAVSIVLDASRRKVWTPTEPDELLAQVVEDFWQEVWTFGEPRPALFHDPRTLTRRPSRHEGPMFPPVSMHAKCVIVDRKRVLVGSANFTKRAQARNIEVGALLEDDGFAQGLLFQWRRAIASGFVVGGAPTHGTLGG